MSAGRPRKTAKNAALEAAHVLDVALRLAQRRIFGLEGMGFTKATAIRYATKRRRGLVGASIGNDVKELLTPPVNKVQAALRLIVEHGVSVNSAARLVDTDLRTLRRLVKKARTDWQATTERQKEFQARTTVTDVSEEPNYSP